MKAETVTTIKAVTDPVCGMRIDPASAAGKTDYRGKTFHFCSKNCLETFEREPEKYAEAGSAAESAGFGTKGLSGEAIATGARHDHSTSNGKGERVDLPITGMTCAACANRIEKQLNKQPGVQKASVNFATAKATVNYDPQATGVGNLIQTVKDVGYDTTPPSRVEFAVDDSARPSGSSVQLEGYLSKLRGITNVNFNLATMNVAVEYLPDATDAKKIQAAIEDFGYRVREVSGSSESSEDSLAAAHAAEYADLKRKFWIAAVLSLPVLVVAMSHGAIEFLNFPGVNWLQLALTVPVVFYSGWQFYRGAWAAFRHRAADMNTLIAVGTGTAFIYSAAATLFPSFFMAASHAAMQGMGDAMPVPVYFEAASVIIALILLGRMLESRAKGQTGEAIRKLIGLQAKTATVIRDGKEIEIETEEVVPGDVVLVRPGGKIPENGILIKGGGSLETAHKLNTVVLDKTGTITEGEPSLTDVVPASGFTENDFLKTVASAEIQSEHPLAAAIVRGAEGRNLGFEKTESFNALEGRGIEAVVGGKDLLLGNLRLMRERGIELGGGEAAAEKLADEGKTPMFASINGEFAGLVAVADRFKLKSKDAIQTLQNLGLEVVMMTGDNKRTAEAVAKEVGIRRVLAEVLPQDKAGEIRRLQAEKKIVAMVGDGINDAPALAQADVGIAIGTGTDVAIEASDITLIKGDLSGVATAIALSKATIRSVKQNLFWAFIYNVVGIPVAAGLLYPFFGILLSPILASVAMSLSSVSVVANSLRLRSFKASVWRGG